MFTHIKETVFVYQALTEEIGTWVEILASASLNNSQQI